MADQARVETRATWNDVDLTNGIRSSQNKLQDFERNVQGVFRRTGDVRAERAISGFVERLTAGDVPGAIAAITSKITGLGLAAGVAFAAAGYGISKFIGDIKETNKTLENLGRDLSVPRAVVADLSVEGLKKQITDLSKDLDAVSEKREGFFHKVASAIPIIGAIPQIQDTLGQGEELFGVNRLVGYMKQLGDTEKDIVRIRGIGLTVSATQAELDSVELKKKQDIAQAEVQRLTTRSEIQKRAIPLSEKQDENAAADQLAKDQKSAAAERAKQDTNEINRKKAIAETELGLEGKIAAIAASGLPAELQKTATIQARIDALQKELALTTEITAREKLQTDLKKAQGELGATGRDQEVSRFKPIFEKAQLSLSDLLGVDEKQTPRLGFAKHQAEAAAHEEQLGAGLRDRGDIEGAFKHFLEAERIKSQIPELSDKEKIPEYAFKSALGRTEELLQNILDAFDGQKPVSLANQ